eukprot:14687238-Alexandrium_andersonii.AAC.1
MWGPHPQRRPGQATPNGGATVAGVVPIWWGRLEGQRATRTAPLGCPAYCAVPVFSSGETHCP